MNTNKSHRLTVAYGFRCTCGWEAPLRSDLLVIDQAILAESEWRDHVKASA